MNPSRLAGRCLWLACAVGLLAAAPAAAQLRPPRDAPKTPARVSKPPRTSPDYVTRFLPTGALDAGFGAGSWAAVPNAVAALVLDASGRVVTIGKAGAGIAVSRLAADGGLDAKFGANGTATIAAAGDSAPAAVAIDSLGRIVVLGWNRAPPTPDRLLLARLLEDGSADRNFADSGVSVWTPAGAANLVSPVLAIGRGNQVFVGGRCLRSPSYDRQEYLFTLRVDDKGGQDGGYGSSGLGLIPVPNGRQAVRLFADQQDRCWIVATFPSAPSLSMQNGPAQWFHADVVVGRLTAAGQPDPRFASAGLFVLGGFQHRGAFDAVFEQKQGGAARLTVAGRANLPPGTDPVQLLLFRVDDRGRLDAGFGTGGTALCNPPTQHGFVASARRLLRDADGNLVVVASYQQDNGPVWATPHLLLLRLDGAGRQIATFGSNGVVDLAFDDPLAAALDADGNLLVRGGQK